MSQKQAVAAALRTARARGGKVHKGAIHSSVAGRTDHLPMHVASGSYVIPADIISAMGEGNSMAGFKVAQNIFGGTKDITKGTPYGESGLPYSKAGGGRLGYYDGGDTTSKGTALKSGSGSMSAPTTAKQTVAAAPQRPQPASNYSSPRQTDGNNGGYSQRPQARPADLAPAQAERYINAWDMINGGGKGAGYTNFGDMINGGGMNAKGEGGLGNALMGKTNGYTGWFDRINGGGKGGSLFNPSTGSVAAPAAGTAAQPEGGFKDTSLFNRAKPLIGMMVAGPAGYLAGKAIRKDNSGTSGLNKFFNGKAAGGATDAVPIVAAGGEYVIPPEDVVRIGGGDLDHGHKVLDAFVKKMRQKTIKTLQSLPGPKKD
jgi:hypothetical protein